MLLKGKESGRKASVMGRGEGGAMGEASKARMWCVARVCCPFAMVVGMERVGVTIPPVVARIFLGDSTSPLTREART